MQGLTHHSTHSGKRNTAKSITKTPVSIHPDMLRYRFWRNQTPCKGSGKLLRGELHVEKCYSLLSQGDSLEEPRAILRTALGVHVRAILGKPLLVNKYMMPQ